MATEKKNERKHELKDIQLFEENGQYYLKLKYVIENEHHVKELEIPKVEIPVNANVYPHIDYTRDIYGNKYIGHHLNEKCELYVGYGNLKMLPGETLEANHVYYTEKTIKEKHKEMTLAEIEKKLGYKIKIVAEE